MWAWLPGRHGCQGQIRASTDCYSRTRLRTLLPPRPGGAPIGSPWGIGVISGLNRRSTCSASIRTADPFLSRSRSPRRSGPATPWACRPSPVPIRTPSSAAWSPTAAPAGSTWPCRDAPTLDRRRSGRSAAAGWV